MSNFGRVLVALSLAGCSAAFGARSLIDDPYYGSDGGEAGAILSPDAGTSADARVRGNPLCDAVLSGDGGVSTCFPDDEYPIGPMCNPAKDAGADAASNDGGAYTPMACRVQNLAEPTCQSVPMQPKAEGDSCTSANDCAAGFECVGSPARCRHYCCDATSCTTYSKNNQNKPYFCDIQPLAAQSSQVVPVCQPVMQCNLQTQDCGMGQTCAIVESNGSLTTSCVAVGPGKVGDACDSQHCGLNLQCIGAPMPTCHQLCDPKMPTCPNGTTCFHQWPVLDMQGVGVCKEP